MSTLSARSRQAVLFVLFATLATGCAVGPDFEKPVVGVPEDYRTEIAMPADSLVNLAWWELFEDSVLYSLVTAALQENKDAAIAASRVEEARAALGFTKADIYPRLDYEGVASRGNLAGLTKTESEFDSFYGAVTLGWELDFWGKFRRANEAARAELMASEYSLRTVQIGLISEVATTYFLLLDYRERLEISKRTLESRLESLDIIQKRFDRGVIPEIDLNQAQIQKELADAAIPAYERLIAKTENVLSVLLGRLPQTIESGRGIHEAALPVEIPVGMPSSLLVRRPDIAQAEYRLMAQNARIGVAKARMFPSISLTGLLGVASDELSTLTSEQGVWSAGGGIFGPLFHFNKYRRAVDIEDERTRQAYLEYEKTVLIAFKEVEDALVEVQTYQRQVESVARKYAAARNAALLSRERYDKGVTSYLEVLDTERTLFSVELEYSELRQQSRNAYVKLYKALGGGWITPEERDMAGSSR